MLIGSDELKTLTVIVAKGRFGNATFRRRDLMTTVEGVVKSLGLWTDDDDDESGSAGFKSRGLAAIDWAISNLKDDRLTHISRDQWKVTDS
jgi:hypothetical protein